MARNSPAVAQFGFFNKDDDDEQLSCFLEVIWRSIVWLTNSNGQEKGLRSLADLRMATRRVCVARIELNYVFVPYCFVS